MRDAHTVLVRTTATTPAVPLRNDARATDASYSGLYRPPGRPRNRRRQRTPHRPRSSGCKRRLQPPWAHRRSQPLAGLRTPARNRTDAPTRSDPQRSPTTVPDHAQIPRSREHPRAPPRRRPPRRRPRRGRPPRGTRARGTVNTGLCRWKRRLHRQRARATNRPDEPLRVSPSAGAPVILAPHPWPSPAHTQRASPCTPPIGKPITGPGLRGWRHADDAARIPGQKPAGEQHIRVRPPFPVPAPGWSTASAALGSEARPGRGRNDSYAPDRPRAVRAGAPPPRCKRRCHPAINGSQDMTGAAPAEAIDSTQISTEVRPLTVHRVPLVS